MLDLFCVSLSMSADKISLFPLQKRDETGNTKAGHIDVSQSVTTGKTTATPHVGSGMS